MNKIIIPLAFFFCLCLACCRNSHSTASSATKVTLEKMIESWCNTCCDYPKSLEEFISINEDFDGWKELPMKDSVKATLCFLNNEKKHITWRFSHPTVTSMNLTIFFYDDTIYRKAGAWFFPGLDASLMDYNKYYFEFPSSIEDLIVYDSLAGKDRYGFYQCCDETFSYLLENKNKIDWQVTDEATILIMSGRDTIAYQLGCSPQALYCGDSIVAGRSLFRFFDNHGYYAHSENVEKALKVGLSELRNNYSNTSIGQTKWHTLVYTKENGLQLFCQNDDLSLNTQWFHEIEEFMYCFCKENELGKVIFVSPSYIK